MTSVCFSAIGGRIGTPTANSVRRCGVALRVHDNVSMNDSPENTAARTLERVTAPFHILVLAGVLNDPAEQARASKRFAFNLKLYSACRSGL
jgi:hypothetical protein